MSINNIGLFKAFAPAVKTTKPPKYPTGKFPLGLLDTDAKGKDPYSKKLY